MDAYVCALSGGDLEVSFVEHAIPMPLVSICVLLYGKAFVDRTWNDYRTAPIRDRVQPGY